MLNFYQKIKSLKSTGKGRCLLNEEEVLEVLKNYGFSKYILEDMSLEEQIELFYDGEFVIAAHGAGLSNLIFSSNIKVLELFPMPNIVPYYYYLSKNLGGIYYFLCSTSNSPNGNFDVDVSKISEYLENLLN
jgi:capsular polysaccharide biosynthesis protein